ncbi:glycosyltransferase family 4 protein [Sulfurihydrogenibium azorense]|uniref:glycosyltransferase family 4 protein n=2 Tax=Sulfurihydrogenibium azorense TaxID=309806 RepID=UPI002409C6E4|nr:glycosyltransferase family 4 protein [Sulfurihydrogenibium azorense]
MEILSMKILWINANPNPNPGGTEAHSIDFINNLENIPDITIYKAVAKGSFVDKNTTDRNKFYISLKSEFSPINTIKLINLARKLKPDFVIGNNGNEYINTFLAGKLSGSKIILFRHMLNYQPFFNKKFILPKVDKIFAVSQASKNRLLKDGVPENKIEILPNFIDEEKFYYSSQEKQSVRKQLNISPNEIVITFIGKVDRGKGIYDYVEVCKELHTIFKNLKFLIIGDGRDLKPALERFKNYSLQDKVITTGNVVNPHWYLKAADVVLVLSKGEESFGRTVIEGFAVKSLVVVYDVENLKYLIENYKTGLIVEKGNINQAVDSIKKVLKDNSLYNTITENAYQEFLQKYTKKKVLQEFLSKLKALL